MTKALASLKNNIWFRISIYVNIFLIYAIGYSAYKLGLIDQFVSNVMQMNPQIVNSMAAYLVPGDNLSSTPWWQDEVKNQVLITQTKKYNACLFGDSISSMLGNTLGNNNFNFSLSGMSTVSLIEQLKILNNAQVKCDRAIIAIGTNDAAYAIEDEPFVNNMKDIIAKVRQMGASRITLIPAFYSTLEASFNPGLAGTITRVEEINALIRQVAVSENVLVSVETIKPLFKEQELKSNLTIDGVHLNADGRDIYRKSLLKIIGGS